MPGGQAWSSLPVPASYLTTMTQPARHREKSAKLQLREVRSQRIYNRDSSHCWMMRGAQTKINERLRSLYKLWLNGLVVVRVQLNIRSFRVRFELLKNDVRRRQTKLGVRY
jgi:hypothetical protein